MTGVMNIGLIKLLLAQRRYREAEALLARYIARIDWELEKKR